MQPRSQVLSPSRLVSLSLSRSVGRVGENPGNEVVLDDVANMDVGFWCWWLGFETSQFDLSILFYITQ